MKRRTQWFLVPAVLLGLTAPSANASIISYSTPAGATSAGGPVSATATFTTGADSLTVVLTNLRADPANIGQNLSDLFFTLNTGQNVGTLSSSSAQEVSVAGGGTLTLGGVVSTGWGLQTSGLGLKLNDLGFAGPAHTIIGPPNGVGVYGSANASIAGNGPHNPFLNQTATFSLSVLGVTADSFVDSATFSFGTTEGDNVPGGSVPEPASLALMGIGLGSMGLISLARRRAKKKLA